MTYTEDDLRYEAARQHAILTEDPDFMSVGEMMQDEEVPSCTPNIGSYDIDGQPVDGEGPTWGDICADGENDEPGTQFNRVQRKIHDRISGAADISTWAVDLGADGLEPEDHVVNVDADGGPIMRMHFAFAPHVTQSDRHRMMIGFAKRLMNEED